jgi:hypothetical protein
MNFIIAYLGETNNIEQKFKFNAYTDDLPNCIECPNCSSNLIFYLIIGIIIIIIVIQWLNKK